MSELPDSGDSSTPPVPEEHRSEWFRERHEEAAAQVVEFLAAEFVTLPGRDVADFGCGDGILDLGLVRRTGPRSLVGFDLRPVDVERLSRWSEREGFGAELPAALRFAAVTDGRLPAADRSFDVVVSWSAFQYVADPPGALAEIRRVLRPGGALMVHLYPFFHSRHGSLLEPWFPDGWAQFLFPPEEIEARVLSGTGTDPAWARWVLELHKSLNRITLEDLHDALSAGGYRIVRVELISEPSGIPEGVPELPLWQLGTGGVKLLARVRQ